MMRDRRPSDRKPRKISAVMADALANAHDHGRVLERRAGGFWTWPGCPSITLDKQTGPVPTWYVSTGTVQGLITRGLMEVTQRLPRGDACAVRLAPLIAGAVTGQQITIASITAENIPFQKTP